MSVGVESPNAALDALVEAARVVANGAEPGGLTRGELAQAQRLWAELGEVASAAGLANLAEANEREVWRDAGAANATAWVSTMPDHGRGRPGTMVQLANAAERMPAVTQAHAQGRISTLQREMLSRAHRADPLQYERDEGTLVRQAETMTARDLNDEVGDWCDAYRHPGVSCDDERSQFAAREVSLGTTWKGMSHMAAWMHPELGELAATVLEALMDPPGDGRTVGQRRADALYEVFEQVARFGDLPTTGGVPTQISLVADVQALDPDHAEPVKVRAAHTGRWWKGSLQRALCHASVRRIVMDGKSVVVDVGEATHVIPVGLYRAVVARDLKCQWPGCHKPPHRCQVHHIIPVEEGGHTNPYNCTLLCAYHHWLVHEGGWSVELITEDGQRRLHPTPPGRAPP